MEDSQRIYTVGVPIDSVICAVEAIRHEGRLLLVLCWRRDADLGLRRPEHVLPMDLIRHEKIEADIKPFDYMVKNSIPRQIFSRTEIDGNMVARGVEQAPDVVFSVRR